MRYVFSVLLFSFLVVQANATSLIILSEEPITDDYNQEIMVDTQGFVGKEFRTFMLEWPDSGGSIGLGSIHQFYDYIADGFPEGAIVKATTQIFPEPDYFESPQRPVEFDICISTPGIYQSSLSFRKVSYSDYYDEVLDTWYRRIYHRRVIYHLTVDIQRNSGSVADSQCPSGPVSNAPKISVNSVSLAQVVYNPRMRPPIPSGQDYEYLPKITTTEFDGVLGKSYSYGADLKIEGVIPSNASGTLQVQIVPSENENIVLMQTSDISLQSFMGKSSYEISPSQFTTPSPLSPIENVVGLKSYKVKLVLKNATGIETEADKPISLNIHKTYSPTVAIAKIKPPSTGVYDPVNIDKFAGFLGLGQYVSDVFPVADNSVVVKNLGTVDGLPVSNSFYVNGVLAPLSEEIDLISLNKKRVFMQQNRAFGVIANNYTQYHGMRGDIVGAVYPMMPKVGFVNENYLQSLPHELAHTFNVHPELYEAAGNKLFSGYSANANGFFGSPKSLSNVRSFMDAGATDFVTNTPWIDDMSYAILFQELKKPIIDPITNLVSFILTKDNQVIQGSVDEIPNGVLTEGNPGGELLIQGADSTGGIIYSLPVAVSFKIKYLLPEGSTDGAVGDVAAVPVSAEIPNDSRITRINLVHNGVKISDVSKNGMLLMALIDRIPLSSFKDGSNLTPSAALEIRMRQKNLLIQGAKNAQVEIDRNNKSRANAYLTNLISQIKGFTSATYVPQDEYELSQSSVVSEINKIIRSL